MARHEPERSEWFVVPLEGIEPSQPVPKTGTLSIKLQGLIKF